MGLAAFQLTSGAVSGFIAESTACGIVSMAGAAIALFWLDRRLLLILIPGGVIMLYLSCALREIIKRLHVNVRESDGRLWVFLSERLGSLMIVRTFAQERRS